MRIFHLVGLALLAAGCVSTRQETESPSRYEFQQAEMGVPFRIVVYAGSKNAAEGAGGGGLRAH